MNEQYITVKEASSSVTEQAVNQNYEFEGVNKVFVYSADLAELNDYDISAGFSRYGKPKELGNRVQEMTLTQDKSFTFTIDKRNNSDTMMTQHAGRSLQRHIDELIVPTVDKYRLGVMAENAIVTITDPSAPYLKYMNVSAELTEKKVPTTGRLVYMTPKFYLQLRFDNNFTGVADKSADIAHNGEVPMIDGAKIIVVPSDYLPKGTLFMVTHPMATVSSIKLSEYNINENPPGISGWLVEARTYYDAFVLNNKKDAIALVMTDVNDTDTDEDDTEA